MATMGASGAVYGFLGCMLVDLLQSWQILPDRWRQLFWLVLQIVAFMLLGTMPYIDNWAHVGGLIFGILASIVFLPYISFGKWDKWRKRYVSAYLHAHACSIFPETVERGGSK